MPIVGYARVSTIGQDLAVQLETLQTARCDKIFKEKRSGVDAGRPELKRCLEYLREGDILLVTKIDRLARSTSDLYRIVTALAEKRVQFKVIDDPSIDTTSRTGKLVMGILALIAEFENDIRRERQLDGIAKARERGVRFGVQPKLTETLVKQISKLRRSRRSPKLCAKRASARPRSIGRSAGLRQAIVGPCWRWPRFRVLDQREVGSNRGAYSGYEGWQLRPALSQHQRTS